jgi:hypothetical protein
MQRSRPVSPVRSLILIRTLGGASVMAAIFMAIAFFAGCESTRPASQSGENSIIKEPDSGRAVHGEVGAMYGRSG